MHKETRKWKTLTQRNQEQYAEALAKVTYQS